MDSERPGGQLYSFSDPFAGSLARRKRKRQFMTTPTKVTLENEGSLAVLRFQGDITSASKEAVLGAYEKVSNGHARNILLDFSKVSYLNSSGIALVIQMLMEANRSGQKVQIFGLTPHFQK